MKSMLHKHDIYQPQSDLRAKLTRRRARLSGQDKIQINMDRPIVSFSFDDCPQSVVTNALPKLEAEGWKATLYMSMGLCDMTNHLGRHMSEIEVRNAYERGHEIGCHTFSHLDGFTHSPDEVEMDIDRNWQEFRRLGLPRPNTFAYPYGEVTLALKQRLAGRYNLLRGVHKPKGATMDRHLAPSMRLYSGKDFKSALGKIIEAGQKKRWLILFTHDVRDNPSAFGITPSELDLAIATVKGIGAQVLPVRDALMEVTA